MKAIITGANGTLGRVLKTTLEARGDTVVSWDRRQTPIDDFAAMEAFVRAQRPDVLFHLAVASQPTGRANEGWLVNYHWTSELAWICRQLNVRFVYTSSVTVFSDFAPGPFTVNSRPDATEGYGYEKRQAEERTLAQNPNAVIARLGWQIGDAPGSNNMVDHLEQQAREHGQIRASRLWFPACSHLIDTADALTQLATFAPGLYLVDSNTHWTFYEIANALNARHGDRWIIRPDDDFVFDQRMLDPRVPIAPLNVRLSQLG